MTDIKSNTPRATYTPEAWAMAEWAIPLHVHPLGAETWDVVNCAGDWKPPTPDQVRSYIAQAIFKFQKETVRQLEQKNEALRKDAERLDWLEDIAKCYWVTVQTQPSANHIYAGQGPVLREAIDAAIKEQSNDKDIKPVAWFDGAVITTDKAWLIARNCEANPLYPESALTQAREEGRREGMREVAAIFDRAAEAATSTSQRNLLLGLKEVITRASEGK